MSDSEANMRRKKLPRGFRSMRANRAAIRSSEATSAPSPDPAYQRTVYGVLAFGYWLVLVGGLVVFMAVSQPMAFEDDAAGHAGSVVMLGIAIVVVGLSLTPFLTKGRTSSHPVIASIIAGACLAGALIIVFVMPSPGSHPVVAFGRGGGIGLGERMPDAAAGLALAALGGVLAAAGPAVSGTRGGGWRRRLTAGLALVVALLLGYTTINALVPSWVAGLNTQRIVHSATPLRSIPPKPGTNVTSSDLIPPLFEGNGADVKGDGDYVTGAGAVTATAGGLALIEQHGLSMIDRSGKPRWIYRRWDSKPTTPVASEDGRLVATTTYPAELDVHGGGPEPRVLVFDAVSGRVRLDAPVPRNSGAVWAIDHETVLLRRGDDNVPTDGFVAVSMRGDTLATYAGSLTAARLVPGGVLVTQISDDESRVALVDRRTGRPRWTWTSPPLPTGGLLDSPSVAAYPSAGAVVVLAAKDQDASGEDLLGLRLDSGTVTWRSPVNCPIGLTDVQHQSQLAYCPGGAGTLQAFDPATGRRVWSHKFDVPNAALLVKIRSVQGGRLAAVIVQLTHGNDHRICTIELLDARSGTTVGTVPTGHALASRWCDNEPHLHPVGNTLTVTYDQPREGGFFAMVTFNLETP